MKVHKQKGPYSIVEYGTSIIKFVLEYSDDDVMYEVDSSYKIEDLEKKFDEMVKSLS